MWIDAHNHLQNPALQPPLAETVPALEKAGVACAVVNGTTEADWPAVAALADRHPWVLPSFGLHPWYLRQRTPQWEAALRELLIRFPQAGVGEIGLDRWMENPDPEDQKAVFEIQWRLAVELDRPVTVHCLRAWGTLDDLLSTLPRPKRGFLLHAYGGPAEMVKRWVSLGACFSFSPSFLAPGRERKLEPFHIIPADRLLVETDAPSMGAPLDIIPAYEGLAALRGCTVAELQEQVATNFRRLFAT